MVVVRRGLELVDPTFLRQGLVYSWFRLAWRSSLQCGVLIAVLSLRRAARTRGIWSPRYYCLGNSSMRDTRGSQLLHLIHTHALLSLGVNILNGLQLTCKV